MLTFKLEKIENGNMIYLYFPEGNEQSPGRVMFNNDGKKIVIEESKDDFKKWYASHALKGIDINKKSGTVAWC